MPVPFKLRFQPTTTDLILSPNTLDFGRIPLSEQAGTYLSITNPSKLPQTFSFGPKLPLGLSITPGGGYGSVLPGETLKLLMRFQPPIPGLQIFSMACRTLAGRVFKLQGQCEGLQLDVELSHNTVKVSTLCHMLLLVHDMCWTGAALNEIVEDCCWKHDACSACSSRPLQ
jgi:hypothetical protein